MDNEEREEIRQQITEKLQTNAEAMSGLIDTINLVCDISNLPTECIISVLIDMLAGSIASTSNKPALDNNIAEIQRVFENQARAMNEWYLSKELLN